MLHIDVYVRSAHLGTIKPFQIESHRLNDYKKKCWITQVKSKRWFIMKKQHTRPFMNRQGVHRDCVKQRFTQGKRFFFKYKWWLTMVTYTQVVGDVRWEIMGCLNELDHCQNSVFYSLNLYYTLPQRNIWFRWDDYCILLNLFSLCLGEGNTNQHLFGYCFRKKCAVAPFWLISERHI